MTEVIVALDVDTLQKAEDLLQRLKGTITFYKVGMRLFTAHGRRAVELVQKHGGRVFLDMKFMDIPQTVAHAVEEAQKLGVDSLSIHLLGGAEMVRAAAQVSPRPKLWGVTVLTSFAPQDARVFHPRASIPTMVRNLARMGWASGADGTICSAQEVQHLRKTLKNLPLKFITPGIRPAGGAVNDQKRIMTPEEAAKLGIDYVVIGRPITGADDPLKAAQDILAAMKHAAPHALETPK